MRRIIAILLGALAFVALSAGASVLALEGLEPTTTLPTTTTPAPTTTTTIPPVAPTTTVKTATTTTVKSGPTTTATTAKVSGAPKPPPASGAAQPLDPSLLGGTPIPTLPLSSSTTLFLTGEISVPSMSTPTTLTGTATALVTAKKDPPPASTMILAAVAWLASLGGLLVFVEDKRGQNWRHLAR